VAALVGSVVAAYYYLRLIKVMWLDPPPDGALAPSPGPTVAIAYATALFAMPVVLVALIWLDPWSATAAAFAR
jgi:NADH-quinone oxidoreductase subunit N